MRWRWYDSTTSYKVKMLDLSRQDLNDLAKSKDQGDTLDKTYLQSSFMKSIFFAQTDEKKSHLGLIKSEAIALLAQP